MSDIVKDATLYRIKQIELAEAEYYKTLIKSLDKIEREVISLASRLPLTDGKLVELQSAIAIRPQIKAILEREYLAWSDTVVRQGFNKQAKRIEKGFKAVLEKARKKNKVSVKDLAESLKEEFISSINEQKNLLDTYN